MNIQWPISGCQVEQVTADTPAHFQVAARGMDRGGCCPDCGRVGRAVHSRYRRRPADLPLLGRIVWVSLRVRRFYCHNTACRRQIFAELVSQLVALFARRTRRLAEVQCWIGTALGGEARARLLSRLAMPASADTALCLPNQLSLPDSAEPRVIGVGDWAKRKGRSYGMIVVDLERRRVMDLLPDRNPATVAGQLRQRPGIKVIAGDPSTEYASAIATCAPVAIQVANWWHVLANLRQAVERWFPGAHGWLWRSPVSSCKGDPVPAGRARPFPRNDVDKQVRADSRARRIALYDEVQRRHAAGEPLIAIAHAMRVARGTVRSYAYASSFPEHAARRPGHSIADRQLPHLQARVAESCEDAAVLWRELQTQGLAGTAKQVRRWLSERRRKPARIAPSRWRGHISANLGLPDDTLSVPLPAAQPLAWLLVQPPATLPTADAAVVARVEQNRGTATAAILARKLMALIRGCNARSQTDVVAACADLDAWLAEAARCSVPTMDTFASGLQKDGTALCAALTMPWSNRQVNRLKLIKRQMYGQPASTCSGGAFCLRHNPRKVILVANSAWLLR